jgi:hypothetical protein
VRIAALLLTAGLLTGCGAGTHAGTTTSSSTAKQGTLQAIWDRPGENVTVVPGDADFAPGVVRYSFLVVQTNGELVSRPTATVDLARGLNDAPFQRVTARLERVAASGADEVTALYVAKLRIREPGTYWLVAQPKGSTVQALGQLEVNAKTVSPSLGALAPRTDTPTLGDAPISMLTTRTPPDRDLLRWSVADSIAAHKPFVVTFATPKYCNSRTCGPVVDVVRSVARGFPQIRFIHVEIYEHNDPQQGQNRWVRAWKLPSEPWTFVVGADGRIKAKFEGAFSARELRRAVATRIA